MIEKIIITSFFVFGYCCTFWEGQIFEGIGNWLDERLPEWISKPLYGCYICACFWWGTALYCVIWPVSLKEWFVVVVSAMGLNAALSKLFAKEEIDVRVKYPGVKIDKEFIEEQCKKNEKILNDPHAGNK